MIKKLLKIAKMVTLSESALFPNYKRYLYQILVAQIEDLMQDCVEILRSHLQPFEDHNQNAIIFSKFVDIYLSSRV